MKSNRPKNLDLTTIKLPIMGVASILHRICAVIIWFSLAIILPVLYFSLSSEEGLHDIQHCFEEHFLAQFISWGFLTALGYYSVGTIKHIIQEFGYCESLEGGRMISQLAIGLGVVLSLVSAFWIWG